MSSVGDGPAMMDEPVEGEPPTVELTTERLYLWLPGALDAAEMLRYQVENREHLQGWEPPRPAGFLTLSFWRKKLARERQLLVEDRGMRLAIAWADATPRRIIGICQLFRFARGPQQSCQLGYSLAEDVQGQGVMTEALRRTIAFAFDDLAMHRIEASYSPVNQRSGAVLERLGFTIEGYARKALFINGAWRDMLRAALVNPAPLPAPGATPGRGPEPSRSLSSG